MAAIVMTNKGFVSASELTTGPIGGTQAAFIELAQAFAGRGHRVYVRTGEGKSNNGGGLDWGSFSDGFPPKVDLHIANYHPELVGLVPQAARKVLWMHNTGHYLLRPRRLLRMLRLRPDMVFLGPYHKSTYPWWAPSGKRHIIPHGISGSFLEAKVSDSPPPPAAVFTSNPLRSLVWLVDLWVSEIRPKAPGAELHVYAGPKMYGDYGRRVGGVMEGALDRARAAGAAGVFVHEPLPRAELLKRLLASRVHLYRGDPGETFCLALAETQTLGVPCVVERIGSVGERLVDGVTGFCAGGDAEFARRAVSLLSDDTLWMQQHMACLKLQRGRSWDKVAEEFEDLMRY